MTVADLRLSVEQDLKSMNDKWSIQALLREFLHATTRRASKRHHHLLLGEIIKAKGRRGARDLLTAL